MNQFAEKKESLWILVYSPVIWGTHFLLSYITAAIWCAKVAGRDGPLGSVRVVIAVYTAVALAGIVVTGWRGFRRYGFGESTVPHDYDTPEARHRFLGFATVLLSILSAVAVIYVAFTVVFIDSCT